MRRAVEPEAPAAAAAADERLRFESLLSDLAVGFGRLGPEQVDRAIEAAQGRICECLDLDRSALWLTDDTTPNEVRVTHVFQRAGGASAAATPGGGAPRPPVGTAGRALFPWILGRMDQGAAVAVQDPDDLPADAAVDRESFRSFGFRSVVALPLRHDGALVGVLTLVTIADARRWEPALLTRLELVGRLFTTSLVRLRSEAALRRSEARLASAVELAGLGFYDSWFGSDSRIFIDERLRALMGFSVEAPEAVLDYWLARVHPADREHVIEVRRQLHGGEIDAGSVEYRFVHPERGEVWFSHLFRVLQRDALGRALRLFGVIRDITALKRSEEALRKSLDEVKELTSKLELENRYLRKEHHLLYGHGQIVGESRAIAAVLTAVEQVAPLKATVLIEGETGVGKELVARRVHELSPRGSRSMVKVNCAALPSTLVESELFGREKGAYTGSVSRELGRFEIADGSTIFLDEIAELPLELQAKLLRVLEEGEFERVGSPHTLHTDARVIAATNRDLEAEVSAGRFRRDLYYRLGAFPIRVPPLRERREDIPLLMWAIVEEFSVSMHRDVTSVPRRVVESLKLYDWPGNVRELRNVIERAMIRSTGPTLEIELPASAPAGPEPGPSLDEAQRRHIAKVLEAAGGRISGPGGAADLLGLKRTTLNSLMKRLGLARPRGRSAADS